MFFWRLFGGTFFNSSLSLLLSVIEKMLTKNFFYFAGKKFLVWLILQNIEKPTLP